MTPAERARGPGLREALVAALRESVLRRGDDQMASWRGVAGDGLTPDEALADALMVSLRAALASAPLATPDPRVERLEAELERADELHANVVAGAEAFYETLRAIVDEWDQTIADGGLVTIALAEPIGAARALLRSPQERSGE